MALMKTDLFHACTVTRQVMLTIIVTNILSSALYSSTSHATNEFLGTLRSVSITDSGGVNAPPKAEFSISQNGNTFTFDATASSDIDGTISTFKWDFGDGTTSEGATVTHTYSTPNPSQVSLTVVDTDGGATIYQKLINETGNSVWLNSDKPGSLAIIYVDSEETIAGFGSTNAIDGNTSTFWHTEYKNSQPRPPHEIQLDIGRFSTISKVKYLPRMHKNGLICSYELYASIDKTNWGKSVSAGSLEATQKEKTIEFAPVYARYVRFVALNECSGQPWTTVAEIDVWGN